MWTDVEMLQMEECARVNVFVCVVTYFSSPTCPWRVHVCVCVFPFCVQFLFRVSQRGLSHAVPDQRSISSAAQQWQHYNPQVICENTKRLLLMISSWPTAGIFESVARATVAVVVVVVVPLINFSLTVNVESTMTTSATELKLKGNRHNYRPCSEGLIGMITLHRTASNIYAFLRQGR